MNDLTKNIVQAPLNQDKVNGLLRKELQQAVNNLLEVGLTAFLGCDPYARAGRNTGNSRNSVYFRRVDTQFGKIKTQVSRDRNGMFHQHTFPNYKQHSNILEGMIIKPYSKDVTAREIADLIEKIYGSYYSPAQVSNIPKRMTPKTEACHQYKFSDKFLCVYLDTTYVPLRRITFDREAIHIATDIKPNSHKEVIDYHVVPSENVESWTEMLQDMKSRGLEQVELFLSNGVMDVKTVLKQTYPKAHFQRCLAHVMRNIYAKVRVDDRETIIDEFKQVHQQPSKEVMIRVLHAFYDKWNRVYNHVTRDLKETEPDLLILYDYLKQIRASIYSTNTIESLNNVIECKARPKAELPTEQSLNTLIGIQAMGYNERYFNRIHEGFGRVQNILESYFDQVKD